MRSPARAVGVIAAIFAGLLALPGPTPAQAAVFGKQRVLTVLASFGPRPFARSAMTRAMADADAFYRHASFGRMSLDATVTPWLDAGPDAPSCAVFRSAIPELLLAPVRLATEDAGFDIATYDRVLYMVAGSDCGFRGSAGGKEAVLAGDPDSRVIVHELGHTWGLPHAGATAYCEVFCVTDEGGRSVHADGQRLVGLQRLRKGAVRLDPAPAAHLTPWEVQPVLGQRKHGAQAGARARDHRRAVLDRAAA